MNSGQEGLLIVGGILGLMILFILSAAPAAIIVGFFSLPEIYLGPTLLGCMAGWVLFFMNCMRKEKIGWKKESDQQKIESQKRHLVSLATHFDGSRKNIARIEYFKQMKEKSRMESKGKHGKQLMKIKYILSDELM